MSTENITIKVAPSLTLYAPGARELAVTSVQATFTLTDEQITELRLIFTVSGDDWIRVDANGWFHMPPEVRGDTFAGGFDVDEDIEIEVRLDEALLPHVREHAEDIFDAAALLLDAEGPDGQLIRTEDWFGLYVKQQRGPVKTGFATTWSGLV